MANPLVGGIFNFQGLLNDFYNWEPDPKDEAGRQTKRTFQANMIDKVANNELAVALARENQSIAAGAMKDAASLELANQKEIMADESAYGLTKMGAEYDYQSQFAKDEANRQNINDALRADLQKNQTKLEGTENRLNIQQQGREDRLLQGDALDSQERQQLLQLDSEEFRQEQQIQNEQLQQQKNIDSTELQQGKELENRLQQIKDTGDQERQNINTQGNVDQKLQQMAQDAAIDQIKETGSQTRDTDTNRIKETGSQTRATDTNRIEELQKYADEFLAKVQGDESRKNIRETGSEERKSITTRGEQDRLTQSDSLASQERQIGLSGEQDRLSIGEQGKQQRENMKQATKEEDKTASRQNKYARGLANMF